MATVHEIYHEAHVLARCMDPTPELIEHYTKRYQIKDNRVHIQYGVPLSDFDLWAHSQPEYLRDAFILFMLKQQLSAVLAHLARKYKWNKNLPSREY